MKKPPQRLYKKYMCVLIPFMIIIMALPSMFITRQVGKLLEAEMQTQVLEAADRLLPHLQAGAFPAASLKELFPSSTYKVGLYPDRASLPLSPRLKEQMGEDAVTLLGGLDHDGYFSVVIWCGDQYAMITVDLRGLLGKIARVDNTIRSLSMVLCISVLMVVGRRMVKPVITLEKAARRVASGDFSVRVPSRKPNDELSYLINSFNAMIQELGDVEMFRNSFVSDVSHEFKIPLTSISGYTKLLQADCSPEEQLEYTQTIIEETTHLSTLVDNILTLNRLEKHAVPAEPETVVLAEQIRRALTLYEPIWTTKELDFHFRLEEVTIQGYGTLLMQVWTNLIDNAIKFSNLHSRVDLTLTGVEDGARFVISDTGCGIDPQKQKHIFDKFYKADHSRNTDGNGLGLAIARRIVEIHGGTITVESQPGRGSRFTILLRSIR